MFLDRMRENEFKKFRMPEINPEKRIFGNDLFDDYGESRKKELHEPPIALDLPTEVIDRDTDKYFNCSHICRLVGSRVFKRPIMPRPDYEDPFILCVFISVNN